MNFISGTNYTDRLADELKNQRLANSSPGDLDTSSVLQWLNESSSRGNKASTDRLVDYLLSERSLSDARHYEQEMNSKRFQIAVEDMKKAGLNPYWISSLGDLPTFQGSSNKYSSSGYLSEEKNRNSAVNDGVNTAVKVITGIVSAIALIAALA